MSHRAQTVFLNALEIPSHEVREAYVAAECQGDVAMRREVYSLLDHAGRLGRFLENDFAADLPLPTPPEESGCRPGDALGPYTLRELIGEGGMGEVYVAEQTEPVRRKVALKIVRPGMATRDVIARFEAERQALALMEHPHIARVFDGGATEAGQPYFVMELVQGPSITDYCDEHRLATHQRLELFVQVCQAVQHAHQKGVVHRDLKPSNVLVPEIDGAPVPKVIDFGIAKATEQKLTDKTIYTQFLKMIGTPLYMSPEQAGLGVVDVDTRSDVYSLGVLLYELLTGTTPFDRETLKSAPLDERLRIIREQEPRRPSATVGTLAAADLTTVAERRGTEPRKLAGALRGELDWIAMRCLDKDRNRRYASAAALAEDVQRFLADEPVEARPASTLYRAGKFVRRNRGLAVASTVVVTALTVVLAIATAGFVTAERRLAEVTKEQENSLALIALLSDMFPNPWGAHAFSQNYSVYEAMEKESPGLAERFRDHRSAEIKVRQIFGEAYWSAGEFTKARQHLERALVLAVQEHGELNETVAELHATLADEVGWNYDEPQDYAKLLNHAETAIEIYETLGIDTAYGLLRAQFAKGHCLLLTAPERAREAEAAQRACVAVDYRLGNTPTITHWDLGWMLLDFGDDRLAEAEKEMRHAMANYEQVKASALVGATILDGLAACLRRKGDLKGAADALGAAWSLVKSDKDLRKEDRAIVVGGRFVSTLFAMGDVAGAFAQLDEMERLLVHESLPFDRRADLLYVKGWLHFHLEDYEEAAVAFRESLVVSEQRGESDEPTALCALVRLALSLEAEGRSEEAEASFRELHERLSPLFGTTPDLPDAAWGSALAMTALPQASTADLKAEVAKVREGLEFVQRRKWNWWEPALLYAIAGLQERCGDKTNAIASLEMALEKATEPRATWREPLYNLPTLRRDAEMLLAKLYSRGEPLKAEEILRNGVEARRRPLGKNHVQTGLAELRLGELLAAHAKSREAERSLLSAYNIFELHAPNCNHLCKRAAMKLSEVNTQMNNSEQASRFSVIADALSVEGE